MRLYPEEIELMEKYAATNLHSELQNTKQDQNRLEAMLKIHDQEIESGKTQEQWAMPQSVQSVVRHEYLVFVPDHQQMSPPQLTNLLDLHSKSQMHRFSRPR